MPVGAEEVAQCKVIYEDFPGWKEPTFGITKWEDLPVNAQKYLTRLSEVAGCPDRSCFYPARIVLRQFCFITRLNN